MKKLIAIFFMIAVLVGISCIPAFAEEPESSLASDNEGSIEENPFEEIYTLVKAHADDLLSALAFLGSLVLALTYKKGLLPTLSSSLGSIGNAVKAVGDTAKKSAEDNESAISAIGEQVQEIGNTFEKLADAVEKLDGEIATMQSEKLNAATMNTIMRAQVDMLYEIFMSSSLPQYSKDAVGERIAEMKAQLAEAKDE